MSAAVQSPQTAPPSETQGLAPVSVRAVVLGLLISVFALWAAARAILNGLGGGPDVPLLVLFAGVALYPILSRVLKLSRRDIIVIYCFVLIASNGLDLAQRFLPAYTVPRYFHTPENNFLGLADEYLPGWFAPKDPEVIRQFFEGADDGKMHWEPWLKPLGLWVIFFLVLWWTLFCLTSILRRHWVEHERLAFPLVTVPLYIASAGFGRLQPHTTIWREPLMWVGFGISLLHFLTIMLHALNPGVPTAGTFYDVGKFLTEQPLDSMRPNFTFIYNPALTGMAYFAPQDLCFSMWFFFLGYFKPIMLFVRMSGLPEPSGFPFYWEQSAGAFVAIALFYAWAAREYLGRVLRAALSGNWLPGEPEERRWAEPMTYRGAIIGAILGFAFLCGWYILAGMTPWVAGAFFLMILVFATIFTRGRAETGVASLASFPFWQASRQLKSFFGSQPLMPDGKMTNLVMLGSLIFLHFGSFPEGMTYQMETLKMGEETRLKTSNLKWIILGAMLVGILVHLHTFMTMAYEWGFNTLAGGITEGGYGTSISRTEWDEVATIAKGNPAQPDWARNGYTIGAALFTLLLVAIRVRFPRSPFHPLGFVMTTSYGYAYWGPYFVAWLAKVFILRVGGVRMYHQLTPIFVGLVLGQIFALGVVWQIFAFFCGDEWKRLADPLSYF